MSNQDSSWQALTKPGEATAYFNLPNPAPLKIGTSSFNLTNAWWLAEISRLIYQPDFHQNQGNSLGHFKYELIGIIDNDDTSTHVVLLQVNGIDNDGLTKPCLIIAFRGTDDIVDWNNNIQSLQTPFNTSDKSLGNVHEGFYKAYMSIKQKLYDFVDDHPIPMFITGHSLGGALATLLTAGILNKPYFEACYIFGSPRVGDTSFANTLKNTALYRVVNNCDIVTTVPISIPGIDYKHAGTSNLLKDSGILIEGLSEEGVVRYQFSKIQDLKDYAVQELFSMNIFKLKGNLPPFLADHAPTNYVRALEKLVSTDYN